GIDGGVQCLALRADGNLLIGGSFTKVSGLPRGFVAGLINDLTTPPVPTVNSAYVTSWIGSNATFDVSMGGLPPFLFQWQFNGTNLSGRTTLQLQLTNLLATDAGLYTLVASNASGTATSAPVRLTVLPTSARPGTPDTAFMPGAGADNSVRSVAEQPDGKLLVAGFFSAFNGEPHASTENRTAASSGSIPMAAWTEISPPVAWQLASKSGKCCRNRMANCWSAASSPVSTVRPAPTWPGSTRMAAWTRISAPA
ncbi:MAG: immunoglobulin domain-containing protein, partial [Verrucomicrobia bacterium]|nr:immunoglobulin domain-containing protein [Verrucomicrobiota bacterium]